VTFFSLARSGTALKRWTIFSRKLWWCTARAVRKLARSITHTAHGSSTAITDMSRSVPCSKLSSPKKSPGLYSPTCIEGSATMIIC